jgi:thiamine-monophosphate kinase
MPRAREFEIIERYFTRATTDDRIVLGIGDDAAIIDVAGPLAVAVDMLVAGTHFPAGLPARAVGHRALAVNLSDMAAVAARPRWATLALSLSEPDPDWLSGFAAGFFALAERFGVTLIGGDTTRGPLTVTVGILGESSRRPLLRSGGRAGDGIFVSGTPGDAAGGLVCLGESREPSKDVGSKRAGSNEDRSEGSRSEVGRSEVGRSEQGHSEVRRSEAGRSEGGRAQGNRPKAVDDLIERFCYPEPRVELGLALAGLAHAAIDVSDGLVADLGHVCAGSGCGASLDLDALPLSESLRAVFSPERCLELAVNGGDDYELCFTIAPDDTERAFEAAAAVGIEVTRIGRLTATPGIFGKRAGSSVALEPGGFVHFE